MESTVTQSLILDHGRETAGDEPPPAPSPLAEMPGQRIDAQLAQDLLADLRSPRQAVNFADLALSAGLGWGCLVWAVQPGPGWERGVAFAAAVALLYRSLAFIHEVFHQPAMHRFRHTWHALSGVPLLIPLLLYLPVHGGHHSRQVYGTRQDGEYDDFKGRSALASVKLFALNLALPVALWVRFALLTPLAAVLPILREKAIPEFVHLALRMPYHAPSLTGNARSEALIVEWWCCAWGWTLAILGLLAGWQWLAAWALLVVLIATLNTIRALGGTHLYVEQAGGRDIRGQMLDSLNIDSRGPLTLLLCPVGLRFHALHHLAPSLPYHALPAAHRRLMERLPAGSDYHQVTVRSLAEGFGRLRKATAP